MIDNLMANEYLLYATAFASGFFVGAKLFIAKRIMNAAM